MIIKVNEHDGAKVLSLSGDLDEESVLMDTITPVIDGGTKRVIVDLSGVAHVNSSGLSSLIRATVRAGYKGGHVVLVNPSRYVAGVLQTTSLSKVFRIYSSVEEAVTQIPDGVPALRAPGTPNCLAALDLQWPCSVEDVKRSFKTKAKVAHPDRGGSQDAFVALQRHYDAAIKYIDLRRK